MALRLSIQATGYAIQSLPSDDLDDADDDASDRELLSPTSQIPAATWRLSLGLTSSSTSPSVSLFHDRKHHISDRFKGGDWAGQSSIYAASGCPSTCVGSSVLFSFLAEGSNRHGFLRLCEQQSYSVH